MFERQLELWPGANQDAFNLIRPRLKEMRLSTSVRLAIHHEGKLFLVKYQDTDWWGLPGGKPESGETDGNLYDIGATPALTREMFEECQVDIEPIAINLKRLGLAEVVSIDDIRKVATHNLMSIFFVHLQDEEPEHRKIIDSLLNNKNIYAYHIFNNPEHLHLFPDAQAVINTIRQGIKAARQENKENTPSEWLTPDLIYFQIAPTPKPLYQIPDWLYE